MPHRPNMILDVFFTVDVEIWCDDWNQLDTQFPYAFQQYIYGKTSQGECGLRYQLQQMREYGLSGVFFVEPLFAMRFGLAPLQEIVGLIQEYGQEVQLHLHTEWENESLTPLLPRQQGKRQFMRDFSLEEQTALIALGIELIKKAGGGTVNAFRAGSFGMNTDTLKASALNHLSFDSSYNASLMGPDSGLMPGTLLNDTMIYHNIVEYPMTVFDDGTRKLRHAQLGACSHAELRHLLWQSIQCGRKSFVMLSHNFELMNTNRDKPDPIMLQRFRQFCEFMATHANEFRLRGFHGLTPQIAADSSTILSSPRWLTLNRIMEQIWRRRY